MHNSLSFGVIAIILMDHLIDKLNISPPLIITVSYIDSSRMLRALSRHKYV